jgi:DNA-binding transcriptional MerR regulator
MNPNLLTKKAAAAELGIHRQTLRNWARHNKGPPTIRYGKRHYYHREVVSQWLKALSLAS